MAVKYPIHDIPVQITVDGVHVTGRVTTLYPDDMRVEITSPYTGIKTGCHTPSFMMAPSRYLALFDGEYTTTITEFGRKRAEFMLRELYDRAVGKRVDVTFEERRQGRWVTVFGRRARHAKGSLPIYVSDEYGAVATDAETFRKAEWVAESLTERPIPGCTITAPDHRDASFSVHDPAYVEAVRHGVPQHLAESNGFAWDRNLWAATRASNAGVVGAALEALASNAHTGSLSSGIHHARANAGAAFCTFNGLAMAARRVADDGARVLILDVDAHCGGGTYSIVRGWKHVDHVDIATNDFDAYTPESDGRSTLDIVENSSAYLTTIRRRLDAIQLTEYDIVLYGAGVDGFTSHGRHPIDHAVLAEREAMVFQWALGRVPIAFCLLGGYLVPGLDQTGLVDLHRLVIAAAALANAGETPTSARVLALARRGGSAGPA